MKRLILLVPMVAIVLILFSVGCSSADEIRESNKKFTAEQTNTTLTDSPKTPTMPPLHEKISVFDVQEGDCILSLIPEEIDLFDVEITECSGFWHSKVLNEFKITGSVNLPGDDELFYLADIHCDPSYNSVIMPTLESWLQGDRITLCLLDR